MITTGIVAALVLFALLVWGVRLFGINVFVVQSGSMEPAYPTGSIVYVCQTDAGKLKEGDVITFRLGDQLRATHRIVEVTQHNGGPAFRTKGDANDHADSGLVTPDHIVGKVLFGIPFLGYAIAYIQHPPGTYVALAIGGLLALLVFLPDLLFEDGKKKENK